MHLGGLRQPFGEAEHAWVCPGYRPNLRKWRGVLGREQLFQPAKDQLPEKLIPGVLIAVVAQTCCATNLGSLKTWAEWTLLPALKTGAIAAVNSVSSSIGGTEFWSITSGASAPAASVSAPVASAISTVEPVAAVAAPVAIGAATVVDIQVHAACAGITPQVELAPTVF